MQSKKHSQVPNNMAEDGLTPREQLVYAVLHSFNNPRNECFPSLNRLSEVSQLSINTIRNSLSKLEKAGYIKIEKKGRKNYYYFKKYVKFEPFSEDFLNNKGMTPTTKSYLIAAQQYMYKDVEGYGKISYPNRELSKQINMSESSIRKCNKELEYNDYLSIVKNKSVDLETGFNTETKLYKLKEIGQAIIWTLKNHEDKINQNSSDIIQNKEEIDLLKQQLKSQQELLDKLLKNDNKRESFSI